MNLITTSISSKINQIKQIQQKKLITIGIGLLSVICLTKFTLQQRQKLLFEKIYSKKRQQLNQAIQDFKNNHPEYLQISQDIKQMIINSSIKEIKQSLYNKKVTVLQVLYVFINQTLSIATSNNLNLITDINFEEALKIAKIQDEEINHNPNIIYQYELFGIPVSVKDTFLQEGFDTTYGVASRCFKPAEKDGIQVALIKKAKGIIFVRSNIPQLAMTSETYNFVYGRSLNPWNKNRGVGGSSGGEAALQATRCSPIGIGSDIAGSLRIPAAFCGVCGFKPGIGRQTSIGEASLGKGFGGMLNVKPSKGALGRNVEDIIVMMKVLFNSKYYDELPYQIQDPYWNPIDIKNLPEKKLKIGYFTQLSKLVPPNCMKRAVNEACNALILRGHQIIELKLDSDLENDLICCFPRLATADGGFQCFEESLQGEDIIPEYKVMQMSAKTPKWISKYLLGPILTIFGQKTLNFMREQTQSLNVYSFLLQSYKQKEMNTKFIQFLKSNQIDAIIAPAFGCPAMKHGDSRDLPLAAAYTWIWNTVDVPTGSLPITVVQEGQDLLIEGKQGSLDLIYQKLQSQMQQAEGLPINVQVISYPNQEETVLKVMSDIEEMIQFSKKHPYPQEMI